MFSFKVIYLKMFSLFWMFYELEIFYQACFFQLQQREKFVFQKVMCQYKIRDISHVSCIYNLLCTEEILSGYKFTNYKSIENILIEVLIKYVPSRTKKLKESYHAWISILHKMFRNKPHIGIKQYENREKNLLVYAVNLKVLPYLPTKCLSTPYLPLCLTCPFTLSALRLSYAYVPFYPICFTFALVNYLLKRSSCRKSVNLV